MDGNIIQILEGDEEKVKALYTRIRHDRRHKGIIKIVDGYSDTRNFPDWSMGFKSLSPEECASISGYKNISRQTFLTPDIQHSQHPALVILKSFYTNNKRF